MVLTSPTRRCSRPAATSPASAPTPRRRRSATATGRFVDVFEAIGTLGKPTIVAANGHVLAGSLGIALACDLIVAKEGVGFGTPEINVGLFPFMIMALIYRNVPRKKATEMLLLGERLTAEEAREAGIVNKVVAADEFDAAVADWAAKLASKSPLVMRLGKDAIWRQLDMPLTDALEYLRSQLTIELSTEDAIEGVMAFFEKREPQWKGRWRLRKPPSTRREPRHAGDRARLRPRWALVDDLHAAARRRSSAAARRRSPASTSAGKLTARERIELLVDAGTFVELGIHAGPHFSQRSMEGKEAPADGVITGWGDVDGRPCAIAAYDFTVMAGSMGMTGELKVGPAARDGAAEADAADLAARLGRRADPGGRRARCSPARATCSARR